MYLTRLILKKDLSLEAQKWGISNLMCILEAIINEPEVSALLLSYLEILESALQAQIASLTYLIASSSEAFINVFQTVFGSLKSDVEMLKGEIDNVVNPLKNNAYLNNKCGKTVVFQILKWADDSLNTLSASMDNAQFLTSKANLAVENNLAKLNDLQEKLKFVQKLKEYIKDP